MKTRAWTAAVLAIAAGVLWVGSSAAIVEAQQSPTVSVTNSNTDPNSKTTTINFSVAGLPAGTKIKDIHIFPPVQDPPTVPANPPKFPKRSDTNTNVTKDGTSESTKFKVDQNKDSSIHLTDDEGVGNGDFTVSIKWAWSNNDAPGFGTARFVFTKNGTKTYDEDDIVGGGTKLGGDLPVYSLALAGDEPVLASIGTTVPLPVASSADRAGSAYRVYSSLAVNEWREDALEIGIDSVSAPVPPAWGLTFTDFDGLLDASGAATPAITIPNDPSLIGSDFYVVATLLESGDPWLAGVPIRVEIQ